jgi:hypothetical protein
MKLPKGPKRSEHPLNESAAVSSPWALSEPRNPTEMAQIEELQDKVEAAFSACLSTSEQAVLSLRYRLHDDAPLLDLGVAVPANVAESCIRALHHNGNGKSHRKTDILEGIDLMNPPESLRPQEEVGLVCGMSDELVVDTEAAALRKLMGYGKKH